MKKFNLKTFAILAVAVSLTSCMATTHTVGAGGKSNGKPGHYDVKKKQWYLLGGLIPLNHVDAKNLAGGAENYTVRVTTSFGDLMLSGICFPFLGAKPQTVRVSKGDK
jgi:predicted small secreted protein